MKKFIAILLVVLMTVSCAVVLSSCDMNSKKDKDDEKPSKTPTPELDIDEAKENLKDAGYEVGIDYDSNLPDGCYEGLWGENDEDEWIYIYYFEDEDYASDYYDKFIEEHEHCIEELKEEIEDIKLELKDDSLDNDEKKELEGSLEWYEEYLEMYQNTIIGKKDARVWAGTKQAIKDSKG